MKNCEKLLKMVNVFMENPVVKLAFWAFFTIYKNHLKQLKVTFLDVLEDSVQH